MAAGPRFQPMRSIWKRYNWYAFYLRKEKVYTMLHRMAIYSLGALTVYLGVTAVFLWNDSVHRSWQHYVKKEQQRKKLIEIIRNAREKQLLPPSDVDLDKEA